MCKLMRSLRGAPTNKFLSSNSNGIDIYRKLQMLPPIATIFKIIAASEGDFQLHKRSLDRQTNAAKRTLKHVIQVDNR